MPDVIADRFASISKNLSKAKNMLMWQYVLTEPHLHALHDACYNAQRASPLCSISASRHHEHLQPRFSSFIHFIQICRTCRLPGITGWQAGMILGQ